MLKYAEIIVKVEETDPIFEHALHGACRRIFLWPIVNVPWETCSQIIIAWHIIHTIPYKSSRSSTKIPGHYTQFSGSMITWGVVSSIPQDCRIQSSFLGLKGGTCRALSTTQPVSLCQEVNEKHETLEKTLAKEEDKPGGSLMAALSP